jgi:hypothetical protein
MQPKRFGGAGPCTVMDAAPGTARAAAFTASNATALQRVGLR